MVTGQIKVGPPCSLPVCPSPHCAVPSPWPVAVRVRVWVRVSGSGSGSIRVRVRKRIRVRVRVGVGIRVMGRKIGVLDEAECIENGLAAAVGERDGAETGRST